MRADGGDVPRTASVRQYLSAISRCFDWVGVWRRSPDKPGDFGPEAQTRRPRRQDIGTQRPRAHKHDAVYVSVVSVL